MSADFRWARYFVDAAYVAQWAQVWQSSMVTHGDGTVDTLFPALRTTIAAAGCLRHVPIGAAQPAGSLDVAWDLAQAWARCCATTAEAYPLVDERKEPTSPGNWLHETRGAVELLVLMPKRGQKVLSRAMLRLAALAFRRRIELAAVDYESIAYKNNFLHEAGSVETSRACSRGWRTARGTWGASKSSRRCTSGSCSCRSPTL